LRSNNKLFHDDNNNDVFRSKHVAVIFTHSSVDCQSANCQLQAVTYIVRCGQQSDAAYSRANLFEVLKSPNCLGPWVRNPLSSEMFVCLFCVI